MIFTKILFVFINDKGRISVSLISSCNELAKMWIAEKTLGKKVFCLI